MKCRKPPKKGSFEEKNEVKEVWLPSCVFQTKNGQCENDEQYWECSFGGGKKRKRKQSPVLLHTFLGAKRPPETKSSGQ